MLSFPEFLNHISLKDRGLDKNGAMLEKIALDKRNLELFLTISSLEEFNNEEKNLINIRLNEIFKEFNVHLNFKNLKIQENPEELIKDRILKYNPSSKVWLDSLVIEICEETQLVNIKVKEETVYYLLISNGLKDILEESLRVFGDYNINFIKEDNEDNDINKMSKILENIEKEEKELQKDIIYERPKEEIKPNKDQKIDKTVQVSENEQYTYGRKEIASEMLIKDLNLNFDNVTVVADIFNIDIKEINIQKNNSKKDLIILSITDYTSSIKAKLFLNKDKSEEFQNNINKGDTILLTGKMQYDNFGKEENLMIRYLEKVKREVRKDYSSEKRVELRVHSKMSSMNGVSSFKSLAKRAAYWGHKAIAITDVADVQGFPEAMEAANSTGLKVIYGLDGNFIDDTENIIKYYEDNKIYNTYVVFDIETTGLSVRKDRITEIGAVKVVDNIIVDRYSQLINPEMHIPDEVAELTNINDALVENEPTIAKAIIDFNEFCKDAVLVAHNATFDTSFIRREYKKHNLEYNFPVIDTLPLARATIHDIKRFNLGTICKKLGVSLVGAHRAVNDAEATAEVFIKLMEKLNKEGICSFDDINSIKNRIDIKNLFESSISIIVKNQQGMKNLYKLVSESHMKYVKGIAKIPRSLIEKYREGLLIGSGNSTSELYKAVFNMEKDEVIENIAKYYDYIEIQPVSNNLSYVVREMVPDFNELRNINKKLYNLGKKLNIPVVATGDVFYLDEKDDIVRRIILNGKTGRPPENAHIPQELYFKNTDEFLNEFSYLGEDAAKEVVIDNSNLIADMCDDLKPIPDGTYPPFIEGSEENLKDMCYKKAHTIYGDPLPEIVEKRLEKELTSIITHGYAVLYIIAQKLVTKSNADGYLVGSRGSVGSSFAATMSDITEVNPLPPHYVCPKCKHSEFIDDPEIGSGVDLPDKNCPECNTLMIKDGHNIPFEVFLGFYGDKEPDIDLNFAGEYQPRAHKYTEELFGEGYVFRAGTIGTVAEKTAYGFAKKFYENEYVRNIEIERLALECTGVKRTSGQHPGGVMICPRDKEIYDFTPIQYPADDPSSGVITTHFDYNFIHGKILKLDILGHDGPTIIKMLEDFTGINAMNIPLNDPDTISLFSSPEKLNMDETIFKTSTGTLGIPEFGTNFVIQMLLETKPSNFAELVRISGLSHGTDVWTNNAQELVRAGQAKLSEVICTREDIMLYLIHAGAENKFAFDTMEKVRKGKGLTPEAQEIMKTLPLPPWYMDSCMKIKYMFPKAHAVAYVMLSFRIAYCKLNYPLAYYATYFTIKLADFDGELILSGVDAMKEKLNSIKNSNEKLTAKDKGLSTILEVVLEMISRGYEFLPPDIYESEASKFTIKDNKVLMPLRGLVGVGESVANNIVKARNDGEFLSIEDLVDRTKATKTAITTFKRNRMIDKLPDSNQLSLFNL